MTQHPFIFSNKRSYRIRRHAAFWLSWTVFQGILYAFIPIPSPLSFPERLPHFMIDSLLFLPTHLFLAYLLMYFVIPVYVVKNKYLAATAWTLGIIVATASVSAVTSLYVIPRVKEAVLPGHLIVQPPSGTGVRGRFFMALLAGLRGGLTVGGMAAAIKLMKHWYVEGQRNLQLQKEAIQSQLQVLKAQVHPHFLFNTLNNIYSHTQGTSPTASKLVMGLSDMLRYMLYECNHPQVSLAKELKMLDEYIGLERIRYGNELELHIDFPGNATDFSVAPLLLLPFVENAFKHGASHVLQHPWLNLSVALQENRMTFKLLNGKPENVRTSLLRQGIGIENVRRRLALLYPGKHELTITDEGDVFIVTLKLQLERRSTTPVAMTQTAASVVANSLP